MISQRGRQPLRGCQPTTLPNFLQNCMKMKTFWLRGGGRGRGRVSSARPTFTTVLLHATDNICQLSECDNDHLQSESEKMMLGLFHPSSNVTLFKFDLAAAIWITFPI